MPAYYDFVVRTAALSPEQKGAAFVMEIMPAHRSFYDEELYADSEKLRKSATAFFDPAKPKTFPGFAPLTSEKLRKVSEVIEPSFHEAEAIFDRTFPDFRCDPEILFGVSLVKFDGNVYQDKTGQLRLRFGIDMIAILHDPEDMPAFFDHELFHLYHNQVTRARAPAEGVDFVWWDLWKEGLAVYVSQRLHPGLSPQEVLWFPKDMVSRLEAPGVKQSAARLILQDFDSKDDAAFGRWFDSGKAFQGFPPHPGYYIGYLIAAELGRSRSLSALAHMDPDEVKRRERRILERMARGA
jgi:hypothetical protein